MANKHTVTILGTGTIGLSFAALHLEKSSCQVVLYDQRPDAAAFIERTLPKYLSTLTASDIQSRFRIAEDLEDAVKKATIVQECLPEIPALKISIWPQVENSCPNETLLWSSTSGITASVQSRDMKDPSRLLVVHPYNPPHVMPLLELVPSSTTSEDVIERTKAYWIELGRTPILIKRECVGFVANRLAFALLREAVHLVGTGVVTAEELDDIVQTSMGPRWAVAGPFKSYAAGGGEGGLDWWFKNIGGTVQDCWDDAGRPVVDGEEVKEACKQAKEAYGIVDTKARDRITRRVLEAVDEEKNAK